MAEINIPGISSKYNTNEMIDDLVTAEKIRLTKMEDDVKELEKTRSTWREVNQDIGNLQRAAKSLYGFENPFSEKKVTSSNESYLTATASRAATFDNYTITIKQVATSDRFFSPQLDTKLRVDAGHYTFAVGDKSVDLKYRGGTLEDFVRRLNEKGNDIIKASVIRDTSSTQVLLLEAIPTGSSNRLQFINDARDFVLNVGMMRNIPDESGKVTMDQIANNLRTSTGTQAPGESVKISNDSILVRPSSSLIIPFDNKVDVRDGQILEYYYRTTKHSDMEINPPPPGPIWAEVPKGSYKGITVRSAPNSMTLPSPETDELPRKVDEWNVFKIKGTNSTRNLPTISDSTTYQRVEVSADILPEDITALVIDNGNTHRSIEIKDIRIFNPNISDGMEPVQPADTASDAIVDYRGIEIQRPTNSIDDLIHGITLNLKRASTEPVDISVTPDTETAKNSILRFVYSYNNLFTRIMVLTGNNRDIIDELEYLDDDEREKMTQELGLLRGNFALGQMKSRLQTLTSSAYPTAIKPDIALLTQIGISTNAATGNTGGAVNLNKLNGYLEIDEEVLDNSLETNISAVKELFGRDTTGDLLIDNGVATVIDDYLTPYTQTGGFTDVRITRIDGQINEINEDITDYKDYLENYEQDLKRQYSNMEGILDQLERSSRELDNFHNQLNNN